MGNLGHTTPKTKMFGCVLAIAAVASSPAQTAKIQFECVAPELIQQRLDAVSRKTAERKATLETLFQQAGCGSESLSEQPVHGLKEPNIVCALQSDTAGPGVIVVGGHWDFINAGTGAVDDWSGAALLPSLYQSLKGTPRHHRFVFVAFAAEETGLTGSTKFVSRLSAEDKKNVRAMINLECLGMEPPEVWASRADKILLNDYATVARSLGVAVAGVNVDSVGDDDSHPFLTAGIPVLTMHSVTTTNLHILHSPADNLKAINRDYYYAAYRLAAVYLAYLDTALN